MYCNLNKAIPVIEEMISRPGGATIKEIKDILKIKRTKVMLRILRNRMDLDLLAMFKMTAEEIKDDMPLKNGRKRKPRQKSRGLFCITVWGEYIPAADRRRQRSLRTNCPNFHKGWPK